ncbi:hypothetical protein [Alkalibaculum bacchi]|jgi:FtsH-binding integral membrane protein|uniref:hypothetical protein n=1 Tax=Alkalibaculum bacchi TaxID=645887 RepID=UPI0026F182EF|nr:hypothetical protein [Alkalibaculum bacchi]
MGKFIKFLKSKEIRVHLITAAIGFIIVLIGSFFVESKNMSFTVNIIGTILMLTSTQEIMNKVPKNK